MTLNHRWRDAEAADVAALQAWVCTDPPKRPQRRPGEPKQPHPISWEHDVQVYFRTRRPPVRGDERFLVGWHGDDELCGLAQYRRYGSTDAFVQAVGVSIQRQGQRCGHDVIEMLLSEIRADPNFDIDEQIMVTGLVDPRNHRSKELLTRFLFRHVGSSGEFEEWRRYLPPAVE